MEKLKELIGIYKLCDTPLAKVNMWSHIVEKIEEIACDNNPDDYSGSLYYNEDDALALSEEREAYKRGYIQAITDLML